MTHQTQQKAHTLNNDNVAGKTQVVTQAQHALELMVGKLLIEQAYEVEIIWLSPRGW